MGNRVRTRQEQYAHEKSEAEKRAAQGRSPVRQAARELLEKLTQGDAETGQWSVENCAAMQQFWLASFLEAEERSQTAKNTADVLRAQSAMAQASREAGEWEKRKAGAMISVRTDLLRDILRRLDEQDALADELLEIEE